MIIGWQILTGMHQLFKDTEPGRSQGLVTIGTAPAVGLGNSLLTVDTVVLVDDIAISIVVVAGLDSEPGMGLGLQVGEEQHTIVRVEEHLTVTGMAIGTPLFGDEVAGRGVGVVEVGVDTVFVEKETEFGDVVHDKVVTEGFSIINADSHVQRRTAALAVLGNLLLGLGIYLTDMLKLGLFVLSLKGHAKHQHERYDL